MPKARNMIIDGYKKGTQLQMDKWGIFYIFNGRNPLGKEDFISYELLTEETRKDAVSTVSRGVIGSLLFGNAGISASLTGKENKIYTIKVSWDKDIYKDSEPSILKLDSDFYKTFMLKCARTEEDQKNLKKSSVFLHPERYTQEVQDTQDTIKETTSEYVDIKSKLKELKSMFEEDLITEQEYNNKKQELLNKM